MSDFKLKLEGLTCEACVKLISRRFEKVPGVFEVNVDLANNEARVIAEAGFNINLLEKSLTDTTYSIVK
jgi:Cu+-exporting ATPase